MPVAVKRRGMNIRSVNGKNILDRKLRLLWYYKV
jgi:hypothetical protein